LNGYDYFDYHCGKFFMQIFLGLGLHCVQYDSALLEMGLLKEVVIVDVSSLERLNIQYR
jgi:hypothetical protein